MVVLEIYSILTIFYRQSRSYCVSDRWLKPQLSEGDIHAVPSVTYNFVLGASLKVCLILPLFYHRVRSYRIRNRFKRVQQSEGEIHVVSVRSNSTK